MLYMESTSSGNGTYRLSVTFGLERNSDIAAVQVQNRVAQASGRLPSEVLSSGVTVRKSTPDDLMNIGFYSPKGSYDALFLSNYININIVEAIRRVSGVGEVQVYGSDFGMRIWLKPDRMAQLGITTSDVAGAIREQNIQAPAGQIGQYPSPPGQAFQYGVEVRGRLATPEEFGNVIVRAQPDGSVVRIRDLARVELGAREYGIQARFNGQPTAAFSITLTPDASAVEVSKAVRAELERLSVSFPPDLAYAVINDRTVFVTESLKEVVKTLLEALLLVTLVVFLFLQSVRATLIPMLTVPVSLLGTAAAFIVLGFSLNTLTLFAMVLAIGIVVDDAIVVVEAAQHHIEAGRDPRSAVLQAMSEVSGPVVAIALVLSAVFVPVAFLGGIAGALYRQFAVTVAISTLISAFVALSLTPALCALLLKPRAEDRGRGPLTRFFAAFNRGFTRMRNGYERSVRIAIRRMLLSLALLLAFALGAGLLLRSLPGAFVPQEDQGYVLGGVLLPEAAALERTMAATARFENMMEEMPGVARRLVVNGFNILNRAQQPNGALLVAALEPWDERQSADESVEAVMANLMRAGASIPEATVLAMNPPPLPGLGAFGGFNLKLQDRRGGTPLELAEVADQFVAAARKRPEIGSIRSGLNPRTPGFRVEVDREKVKKLGVPLTDVLDSLQAYLGGLQVNEFNRFGRAYRVTMQAEPEFRGEIDDIELFHVRSPQGEMVPLSTLVKPVATNLPAVLQRYNQFRQADISGDAAPGYSAGQAIDALEEVARTLPAGYAYEWSGLSRQQQESSGQAPIVFALALAFVFLFLAGLYESWSVPFAVLLAVPIGVFGALLGLELFGLTNNVYAQIGLILLIGLSAKNAILIVEFAKVRRDHGMDPHEAAVAAARLRLRPILMTSFAFILGVLPLALATGAGAASREAMGVTVSTGMLVATLFGVFLVPVLFTAVDRVVPRGRRR
jgi:hydrophobe/amphiphile efflux-1 (HAE1) family protein